MMTKAVRKMADLLIIGLMFPNACHPLGIGLS